MYTVLFADDTDVVRNLLCAALRQAGYCVLEAGDGYEGVLDVPSPHGTDSPVNHGRSNA